MTTAGAQTWHAALQAATRRIGPGLWAGLLTGALIGGVGGRLAMLLLRTASDPMVLGVETDDGFVIGEITGATFFLIFFTAALGVIGGVFYLGVRGWLPTRFRPLVIGVFGGIVGGSGFIEPGGVDFSALEPRWLAFALFVSLPAAYGAAMSALVERLLAKPSGLQRAGGWLNLVPLVLLVAVGPAGIIALAVLALAWGLNLKVPALGRALQSQVGAWVGRAAMLGLTVVGAVNLVRDGSEIL